MTQYAPLSVEAVEYTREVGGCGETHRRKNETERLAVSCKVCEPLVRKYETGWGATPDKATRTEAELEQLAAEEVEANKLFQAAGREIGGLVKNALAESRR